MSAKTMLFVSILEYWMLIKIPTESYNEKRYGKPWIAKIIFLAGDKTRFLFGNWDGSPGLKGELSIDANHGDVLARGQKGEHSRRSRTRYYLVLADGNLDPLGTDKDEARKAWERYKKDGVLDPHKRGHHHDASVIARKNVEGQGDSKSQAELDREELRSDAVQAASKSVDDKLGACLQAVLAKLSAVEQMNKQVLFEIEQLKKEILALA